MSREFFCRGGEIGILKASGFAGSRSQECRLGFQRAVGDRGRDIRLQFIVKAIVLSTIGLGVGTALLLTHSFDWPAAVSTTSVATAFGVSFAVGGIFGYFTGLCQTPVTGYFPFRDFTRATARTISRH